jgi:hypothetical protein
MKIDETLSAEFGIEPMKPAEVITADGQVINASTNKIEDDYDHARNNLRLLLLDGQAALQTALAVAQQSEHPRAIEVVGNLMKQLADINQQLLDLHQQKQKLDAPKEGAKKEVTNNNAIFVGSTADLNKMLKNMTKGDA